MGELGLDVGELGVAPDGTPHARLIDARGDALGLAGHRKGSLYAVKWGHVDLKNGTLTVRKTTTRKPLLFELDPTIVLLLNRVACGPWPFRPR